MQEKVSITVPPEHTAAVRDCLVEDLGVLAESIRSKVARMNELSEVLASSRGGDDPVVFKASSIADRLRLREWAKAANADAENTLNDLDGFHADRRNWWEQRSRSLQAVSEQILGAVAPAPWEKEAEREEATIVTLDHGQRDALLKQLDFEVAHELGGFEPDLNTVVAERQILQDVLELAADLTEDEQESYPLRTRLESGLEVNSGWDDTRRSVRLGRLARKMLESAEEHLAKFPQGRPLPPWATGPLHPEETQEDRAAMHDEYQRDAQVEHEHQLKVRETCLAILEGLGQKASD